MHVILKKKFGQNFLIDKNILTKISDLIPRTGLKILEIGPGDGKLTSYIIKSKPNKLTLIEIDKNLIQILKSNFKSENKVSIINTDILKYELSEKIDLAISNLPYNISSQILIKFCLSKNLPEYLIFMFQKEFAKRLLDKKLNSINSLVNCFYDINFEFNVSKNCFRPIPKIESTVLLFIRKNEILINENEIKDFIRFKQTLFSHKRKILKNLLRNFNFPKNQFDLSKRVEDLSLEQLLKIFREVKL